MASHLTPLNLSPAQVSTYNVSPRIHINQRWVLDTPQTVKAIREIILSAGSIGTPNILLHSGVGDAGDLARVGIQSTHQLPSVGRNFTDHIIAALTWFANSTETLETIGRNTSLQEMLLQEWKTNGTGFFSGSGIDHLGYVRLADNASIFDNFTDPAGPNTGHIELVISVSSDLSFA